MGCGGSKEGDEEPQFSGESAESKALNEELDAAQKEENKIIKLLVLGTGESGKSTVFKQMKILYSVPDPPSKFLMVVRANLFGNAHAVHQGMEKLDIKYATPEGEAAGTLVCGKPADGNVDNADFASVLAAFNTMYTDSGVNESIERAAEYQLNDSTRYFWDRAAEILSDSYLPSEQDVLRARVRTTGIVQQNFKIKDSQYTMFDVGGQRNERRKWIHCFDNVTAVIFVTAISEYDQVLYEDENTNRMDEALTLFDQILNHPSFTKTSMILFLNKRDLFEMKLKKKDLSCWRPEAGAVGQDYDKCIEYITNEFMNKNKEPERRQVYCHATCATDTSNISFVMDSVFDIILKENLRKMDVADVDKMAAVSGATGASAVKYPATYANDTIVLAASFFVDTLSARQVLTEQADRLPSVEVMSGFKLTAESQDWTWVMGLGKNVPSLSTAKTELGSFPGNFKDAVRRLREVLGIAPTGLLGSIYDKPIPMKGVTLICCQLSLPQADPYSGLGKFSYREPEEFENACYKAFCGIDTAADPCKPPAKGEEFNPFAPSPVGHRWFKGIQLYTAEVNKKPKTGTYVGICKVLSSVDGFSIMVNEHNRIMIPLIFLTEAQLSAEELKWMQGVRVKWERNMKLLGDAQPNRGWLGPEMSGEDEATFPQKMWWAIDEAKARLGIDDGKEGHFSGDLGSLYDADVIDVDEDSNLQMVMFASMAKDRSDLLPGHIWVDRSFLEVQNMKYMCPKTLGNLLSEQNELVNKFTQLNAQAGEGLDIAAMAKVRQDKDSLKIKIEDLIKAQTPLKWINRVIMWVADKMPSFADKIKGGADMSPDDLISAAINANTEVVQTKKARAALIAKYKV